MDKEKRRIQLPLLLGLILILLMFLQQDNAEAFQISQTPEPAQFTAREEEAEIQYLERMLALGGMDEGTRDALEEKLRLARDIVSARSLSENNWSARAESITQPTSNYVEKPFQEGIFEDGEGFISSSEAIIYNYWQGAVEDGFIQVFAGFSAKNPMQGVLYIVHTSVDRLDTKTEIVYPDEENGGLRILEVNEGILILESQDMQYCFDILKRQFVCAVY